MSNISMVASWRTLSILVQSLGLWITNALALWFTRENVVAFFGAMAIWFVALIGTITYELGVAKREFTGDDPHKLYRDALARYRQLRWPIRIMAQFVPGLWIGSTALSPIGVVITFMITMEIMRLANEQLPPHLPEDPLRRSRHGDGLIRTAVTMYLGATAGVAVRRLLGR